MSEEKAADGGDVGLKTTGNLLVPANPLANRARRGSIASIFEQASNQPERDGSRFSLSEENAFPVTENGQAGTTTLLRGKPSAEKVKPATKIAPAKKKRKRRKTLHDSETPQIFTRFAECLEVTQSRWVQDPEDPSREIVTLTGEVTSLQSETLDCSFRWIHYHREAASISFEDFEKVLDKDQGLYEDEVAVASKCVKEAKLLRRTFARGKYFEPTVHQVSDIMGTEIEKVPIRATFTSFPVFALMNRSDENLPYLNRRASRAPARHPIRSLLQYTNILAFDTERDKRQVSVVTRLGEDERADSKPFIHVPEFWALIINMYTVITCAPFSSKVLLGENIQLLQPPTNRQRFLVKFTSLRGTLHDLRCQTWFGLLDAISRIEWHIKDIDVHLNDSNTEYKLIDHRFKPINQDQWAKITEAKGIRHISVRLVRVPEETTLTLEFASRKLRACVNATWVLLGLPYQENILEAKLVKALAASADRRDIENLKLRLAALIETERKFKRSRYFNRMLLYAARSHILNPRESLTTSRKGKTRRAFGRVVMASKLGPALQSDVSNPNSQRPEMRPETRTETKPAARPVFHENRLRVPDISIRRASVASTVSRVSKTVQQQSSMSRTPSLGEITAQREALVSGQSTKVGSSWYEPRAQAYGAAETIENGNQYNTYQQRSRPGSPANRMHSLWAPTADRASLDRVPLTEGRIIPAIVDPYSSEHSFLAGREYAPIGLPSYGISQQLPRPRSGAGRRHSSFGIAGEVLAASPLRLPLRVEDHTTPTKQPALSLTPPESHTPQPQQPSTADPMGRGPFEAHYPPDDDYVPVTVVEKAEKRARDNVGGRTPFFQWQATSGPVTAVRVRPLGDSTDIYTERKDMAQVVDSRRGTEAQLPRSHAAHDILTDIDSFIVHGKYHNAPKFDVSPSDYEDVVNRKRSEVMSLLQSELQESARPSLDVGPDDDDPSAAKRRFADSKMRLLLSVHGFLECFVNQDEVEAKVLGKIWGLMYKLCELQLEQAATVPYPVKRETKFVLSAAEEVEKMEFKCKELLHTNQQLDTANNQAVETSFRVPPPLFAAFMDFTLFLLSIHLAVWEFRVGDESVNMIKDKVHQGLHQSHSIFLRMNEHLEMDLDQIGYESIRTADSLLGLLVENALNISCREAGGIAGDETEMDFDIVDIYSRYTASAIDRAKQEASARVYEDIRLLREEIDTISLVLKHQFTLFQRALAARESAPQLLDKRYTYRINTNLDEMIRHFSTLSDYAIQAEFWARNSIEVRSENNNKAIYVFTAVTIVFLPLSFVTGLLGMNTYDVRNLTHGQWLFWATALPLTLAVLIICLCIVNYKFKFKKRVRRFLLRNRIARSFRRITQSARSGVQNAYFHGGHAGYGLRLLLPYGWYQRWRIRKTEREMEKMTDLKGPMMA